MNKKKVKTLIKENYIVLLAMQNILVAVIDKVIVSRYHVYGAPLVLTVILWIGILRKWRLSQGIYVVLAVIEAFAGIYTLIGSVLYIIKGYDPTAGILQTVLGCSYAISIFVLYKRADDY